jgi:hypothetical protein
MLGTAAMLAGAALPAYASFGGTINSSGPTVNLRSGPGTNYSIIGSIAQGTEVFIDCVGNGTAVSGPFGTTTLWDEIGSGRWVTDAFVKTGTNNPIAMPCRTSPALGGGSGSIVTNVVDGCDATNSGGGANHGSFTSGPDWFPETTNVSCDNAYYYTYGNGPDASGSDFAYWGYYPGASATCRITVHIPPHTPAAQLPYASTATYEVYTNPGDLTAIGGMTVNQSANAGQDVSIGTYQPDDSGYLRVRLDDSDGTAGASQVVVANSATFSCTSEY